MEGGPGAGPGPGPRSSNRGVLQLATVVAVLGKTAGPPQAAIVVLTVTCAETVVMTSQ